MNASMKLTVLTVFPLNPLLNEGVSIIALVALTKTKRSCSSFIKFPRVATLFFLKRAHTTSRQQTSGSQCYQIIYFVYILVLLWVCTLRHLVGTTGPVWMFLCLEN